MAGGWKRLNSSNQNPKPPKRHKRNSNMAAMMDPKTLEKRKIWSYFKNMQISPERQMLARGKRYRLPVCSLKTPPKLQEPWGEIFPRGKAPVISKQKNIQMQCALQTLCVRQQPDKIHFCAWRKRLCSNCPGYINGSKRGILLTTAQDYRNQQVWDGLPWCLYSRYANIFTKYWEPVPSQQQKHFVSWAASLHAEVRVPKQTERKGAMVDLLNTLWRAHTSGLTVISKFSMWPNCIYKTA